MNKAILITGASRGIGAATAIAAAKHGIEWGCVRSARRHLKSSRCFPSFKSAHEALGLIMGLVNNAGILEQQMRLMYQFRMKESHICDEYCRNFALNSSPHT